MADSQFNLPNTEERYLAQDAEVNQLEEVTQEIVDSLSPEQIRSLENLIGEVVPDDPFEQLFGRRPEIPKELVDINSYEDDGSLKLDFIPIAIAYNFQSSAYYKSIDHAFNSYDRLVAKDARAESLDNKKEQAEFMRAIENHEAMKELIAKEKVEMTYEWVWDVKVNEKVRVLVPKRV